MCACERGHGVPWGQSMSRGAPQVTASLAAPAWPDGPGGASRLGEELGARPGRPCGQLGPGCSGKGLVWVERKDVGLVSLLYTRGAHLAARSPSLPRPHPGPPTPLLPAPWAPGASVWLDPRQGRWPALSPGSASGLRRLLLILSVPPQGTWQDAEAGGGPGMGQGPEHRAWPLLQPPGVRGALPLSDPLSRGAADEGREPPTRQEFSPDEGPLVPSVPTERKLNCSPGCAERRTGTGSECRVVGPHAPGPTEGAANP